MTDYATLVLQSGREKSVHRRHPWLFSGSIAKVEGQPQPGDTVDIRSSHGERLALGAYAPQSRTAVRIWTWDLDERIDEAFILGRMRASIARREAFVRQDGVTAYREIFAESDGFPGLVVDRYGDMRVFQLLSPGPERWREVIAEELLSADGVRAVYERSDSDARAREGLPTRRGLPWGDDTAMRVVIEEHGLKYHVDLQQGHKTGFYLDQRESRKQVLAFKDPGDVLNCFAYTGPFTCCALAAGARSVVSVESSAEAIDLAKENLALNRLDGKATRWLEGDVFKELRRFRDAARQFDTIILDPPRFAATAAQVHRASRGYKDINLLALKLLRPGGRLLTFSCSGGVSASLFQKIVAGAALDAEVNAVITGWFAQPEDHPVNIHIPESRYLKGLLLQRID